MVPDQPASQAAPVSGHSEDGVFAGIDVGGTHIAIGLTDGEGRLLAMRKQPTAMAEGGDGLVQLVVATVGALMAGADIPSRRLKAAGIGMPGFLDAEQGIVLNAANMNLHNEPVAAKVSRGLGGVPVWLDNDVRLYIYGETIGGAAAGYHHVLGVTVGTGLAAAFITDGRIHRGAAGLAGEIGHVAVAGHSALCGCGQTGCLETLASAGGIVRLAAAFREQQGDAGFGVGDRTAGGLTAADVAAAAAQGDLAARRAFEHAGSALGETLAVAAALLSPDLILVGGGVSQAGELLLAPLRAAFGRRIHPMFATRIRIERASRSESSGIIGSAMYAQRSWEEET